jgi:hypothetical protein
LLDHDVTLRRKMGGRSRVSAMVRDPISKRTLITCGPSI